jgi:hypothetical protein
MKIAGVTIQGIIKKAIAQYTRDNTAVDGDVSYTGIGFSPDVMFVMAFLPNTSGMSLVHVMGSVVRDVVDVSGGGNPSVYSAGGYFVYITTAAGKAMSAVLKSVDADGFTLTWTKTGATVAGTIYIDVIALKLGV